MDFLQSLAIAALSGAVAGLIAWGGVKRDLVWLGRAVVEAKDTATRAHARIDDILKGRT